MKTVKLADILIDPVHHVAPDMPVTQALERMRQLHTRALAVVDAQGHPLGIFTERDAVRAVYQREQMQGKSVQELMGTPPLTASADEEGVSACRRMVDGGVRHLIVVDARGQMAGVVTEGSFIRHPALRQRGLSKDVASAMSRELSFLPADAQVRDALGQMVEQQLDCVLVGKDCEVAGVVDERDLLRAGEEGEAGLSHQLGDVMGRPAATIPLDATLGEAIRRMDQRQVSHLLVTDVEGRFVGHISEHAIATELATGGEVPLPARERPATHYRSIRDKAHPWLFALLAALLVLAGEQIIEHFARQRALEHEKNGVLNQLSAVRARLEGVVQANLFLAHGLAAVIETQPDIDQARFSDIARGLVDERHALRNIAVAPDMVISLIYPLAGNEAALGLDYRTHPGQRAAALRARDSGHSVLAGPLRLQQGGIGFVAREPVFLAPARPGDERRFWGLVSAVFDAETLYKKAGLRDPDLGLDLALRGTDGTGSGGPVFFGDAQLFSKQAVTLDVSLPGGSWQLAAIPSGGWGRSDTDIGLIRLLGLLAALAAGFMAYRLARDTQALAAQSARLRALLNTIPDLIWLKDPDGVFLACNPRFEQLLGARESDLRGKTDQAFVVADQADAFRENDRAAIAAGGPRVNEEWVSFASDGHRELLETTKAPVYDKRGGLLGVLGIARDITERKRTEEHIHRLNRLYGVLSGINEAIIRLRDPQALFDEACRIAVEVGELRMAWLGMADPDGCEVRPLAHAGVVDHYLEAVHISLDDDERASGPTGRALRAGQHIVCNDIAHDPSMAPWREAALSLGYRASAGFPIRVGGQVRGVFSLYANARGFFDEEELRLLDKLAEDIGFALEFIEADRARETLNRRMLDLLESMSDGFVSLDREWRFQYVNRKAGEIFARAPGELIGKPIWGELPEGIGSPFQKASERAMGGGEIVCIEEYFAPWARWFESRIYPTQDGISIFFTDISARKQQEAELMRLHSTLNALVEGSTDAIFVKNREGRYIVGNQALSALLGRPIEAILGADDYALFPEALAERFRTDDQRIMAAGVTNTYEEPVVTPGATYSHLTTKGPLIIDGEVRGVFGISRDITDRKRAEVALVESESRLRLFIEHAPAALAMFDREMRYLAVSRRWLTDYQLERSDILGQSHYEIFPEIPERWKAIHRRGLAGELVRANEDGFERADGTVQWLRWEVRPWFAADSEVGGIVIFSEDISEQKLAEAKLRRQKDLLDHTGRLAHVGGWEIDVATMQVTLTDEIVRIHGLEPGPQITPDQVMACLSDSVRAQVEQAQRNAIEHAQPYDLSLQITTAKGERRWVHAVGLPVLKAGRVVRIEGAIQDITERKLAEAQARQGELVLDSVFQALPDLFFLMDADGTIRDYRARQSGDLYVSPEVFLGKRMQDVLPAELGELYQRKSKEIAEQGGMASYEYDLTMPDGVRRYEARLTCLPDSTQMIAVVRDITRQYQDRLALAASESRYRSLLEMAPFPAVFSSLRDGTLLYGNHRAERLYGLSREQGIGLPAGTFYQDAAQRDRVIEHLRQEGRVDDLEVRMQTVDGQPFWALVSASIVDFGNEPAIFAAINDITARKRMEDDIRQLNAELEDRVRQRTAELAAVNKELETFTYSVSHDLKAPLRGIDGYSRLLLEDYQEQLDEPGRQLVNNVRDGVAQMSQLIEDLLTYSRMERRSMSGQTVDLARLVAGVVDELQADIQARGMLVDVSLQDLSARADPEGLAIVLRNLVDNALKFSRDSQPPTLSISGLSGEKSITLKISDNGIGFDMQFHNRIFEIFQRLQRAEDYPGTGVGLAIVHKAMQRMGGRVWAESAPGQGTTFYLELPR